MSEEANESDDHRRTVRAGYDAIAGVYDDRRDAEGPERDLVAALADSLPDPSLVLDAGCGAGRPAASVLARRHRVVGLDASRAQLDLLGAHVPAAARVRGDLAALPVDEGAFDALVCLHAIIHVPREEHAAVLGEFARVLRPGGRLLVTVGTDAWEGTNHDWLGAGREMRWSFHGRERTVELLRDAGFAVTGETTLGEDSDDGGEWVFVRARREGP